MNEKDRVKNPKSSKKTETNEVVGSNYIVSEGLPVTLDARDLIGEIDRNSIKYYLWKQTAGTEVNTNDVKDHSSFSFTAPYIQGNNVNTRLTFELIVKDNNGMPRDRPYIASVIVKRVQRAIIFQGGVALGAYEAGVFKAILKKLVENDEYKIRKGVKVEKRPMFDIVAGASIGAMNGAIIVSSVTKKGKSLEDWNNWEDSAKEVTEFWRTQQYHLPTIADFFDMNPSYHYWRDFVHSTSKIFKNSVTQLIEQYSNVNPDLEKWYDNTLTKWSTFEPNFFKDYFINGWYIPATAEATRRYYSAKQFLRTFGAPNVASGIKPWAAFAKFSDFLEQSNYNPRPDNRHYVYYSLKRTLEQYADFPIKTKEGEPRFLLVTVDVQTGDAVTFDSYATETKYHDDKNIVYNERGIEIEHALATGTFPGFFDFPKFKVNNAEMETETRNEEHIFWDGGFRSNTPLREVIQAHRDYWHKIRKHTKEEKEDEDRLENDVPDLEVYIADLWPSELKEKPISFDHDFVENRKSGIIFGDRTDYDEQVANFVTDYIDLAKQLKNLAQRSGVSQDEISHILDRYATSKNTIGQTRKYGELLGGRFRLTKVVRIDHKDDGNEVADKVFDYSQKTIEKLMEVGNRDALIQMDLQAVKDEFLKLEYKFVKEDDKSDINKKSEDIQELERLEREFQQIQQSVKTENSHDRRKIINQVECFIGNVSSLPDELRENNNRSIKEERELVLDAAKQFKETILLLQA